MRQTQRVEQRQELSLEQAQRMRQAQTVGIRVLVLEAVHGERFRPSATCPNCSHVLLPVDILRGYPTDPQDVRTTCPNCRHRFRAILVAGDVDSRVELPFYCPSQTLARMTDDMAQLDPEAFAKHDQGIYRSALFHFGTLKAAFASKNVTYAFDAVSNWKEKIRQFVGRLPDTELAKVVDQPVGVVRAWRKELGIGNYRKNPKLTSADIVVTG